MEKAKQLAFFYLRFRNRTVKEMKNYLLRKKDKFKFADEDIEATMHYLQAHNYLNDTTYVEESVRSKIAVKPQGQKRLRFDLKRKGIEEAILNKYFLEEEIDEAAMAKEALQKKWSGFSKLESKRQFEKAARFLASRGFSYGIIKKTIADLQVCEVQ